MNEKRFTVNELVKFNYSEIGEYVDENHTDRPLRNDKVVALLNEQQATIEHLTKSRDKWSKSAKLHSEYFNCLEKAIEIAYEEKPYPKIEDIMNIYSKLEKEINDE